MKQDREYRVLVGAIWLVTIVAAATLVHEAASLPEPMQADALARTLHKLRSNALEARALALQAAQGQLTAHYIVQQHREIGQDLGVIREALDRPPPRGHEPEAAAARAALEHLDALMKTVPTAIADEGALRRIADAEGELARGLPGGAR